MAQFYSTSVGLIYTRSTVPQILTCILTDRHLVHEVTSPQAFEGLENASRKVRRPDCTLATTDHVRRIHLCGLEIDTVGM